MRAALAGLMIAGGRACWPSPRLVGEGGETPAGFLVAFAGSVVAGTGLLVGARFVIPWLVGMVSRLLGNGPVARVAGRNAVLDPLRTTRSTMGLVVGVTLVTTFASGLRALQQSVGSWDLSPVDELQMHRMLSTTTAMMIAIVLISAVISAVGFVSTMSLTVIQRRREIGLLRTLGLTRRQVRRMITLEAAALSGTAVAFGIALGVVFGSLGAQSIVGSMTDGFVWGLPWGILAAIAAAGSCWCWRRLDRLPAGPSGSARSRRCECRRPDRAPHPRGRGSSTTQSWVWETTPPFHPYTPIHAGASSSVDVVRRNARLPAPDVLEMLRYGPSLRALSERARECRSGNTDGHWAFADPATPSNPTAPARGARPSGAEQRIAEPPRVRASTSLPEGSAPAGRRAYRRNDALKLKDTSHARDPPRRNRAPTLSSGPAWPATRRTQPRPSVPPTSPRREHRELVDGEGSCSFRRSRSGLP